MLSYLCKRCEPASEGTAAQRHYALAGYRTLTDQDLTDIFAYLKTLKPVAHRVDNTETPTLCRICGSAHGLGEKN